MARFTRSNVAIRNVLPGTPVAPAPTVLSDTFNRANTTDIVGQLSNAALGGIQRAWEGFGTGVGITDKRLTRSIGTGLWFAGLPVDTTDFEFSFTYAVPAVAGSTFYVVFRKDALPGTPDEYRLQFGRSSFNTSKRVGGTVSSLNPSTTCEAGARFNVRLKAGRLVIRVNDAVVVDVHDSSITGPGYVGVAGGNIDPGFGIDDFVIQSA